MKLSTLIATGVALATLGCNTVGPRAVRTARQPYNEALATARDQEILWNLLRIAEGKKPHFLRVDTLLTKYTFNANASVGLTLTDTLVRTDSGKTTATGEETTITDADTDAEASATSAGGAWEEQPTVTYKPLDGEDFARRILAPVSLENLALLFGAGFDGERLVELFVSRAGEFFEGDKNLERLGELVGLLQRRHDLQFVAEAGQPEKEGAPAPTRLFIALRGNSNEACEFFCMLPKTEGDCDSECKGKGADALQYIPMSRVSRALEQAEGDQPEPELPLIVTRSLTGAIRTALGVEGSESLDLLTLCESKASEEVKALLRCSDDRPASSDSIVSVSYRGKWFSIPADAPVSREAYLLFSYVYTMQAAEPAVGASPDIVLPIG